MAKEPLYPHVPKSRQPQFPHVPTGQQAEKLPQTEKLKHFWVEENKPYGTWAIVEAFPGGTIRSPFDTKEAAIKREEELGQYYEWKLKLVPSPQEKFPKQHEILKGFYPYEIIEYHDDGDLTIQSFEPLPRPKVGFEKGYIFVVTTDGKIFKQERPPATTKKLPQTLPRTGTCYQDAWRFLIKEEEGYLVHGTLFSGGRRMGHAWVETLTGWVWEPETGKFFTATGFRDAFAPVIERVYSPEEAAIMVARTKNFGPWTRRERVQYLRDIMGLPPQTLNLLASTEGDPIRKFCCRLCGECAPKELLEEGRFLDRISWLRSHYKDKHPGKWGKMTPMTIEEGETVSPEYQHLASLVREPLPKEAD